MRSYMIWHKTIDKEETKGPLRRQKVTGRKRHVPIETLGLAEAVVAPRSPLASRMMVRALYSTSCIRWNVCRSTLPAVPRVETACRHWSRKSLAAAANRRATRQHQGAPTHGASVVLPKPWIVRRSSCGIAKVPAWPSNDCEQNAQNREPMEP